VDKNWHAFWLFGSLVQPHEKSETEVSPNGALYGGAARSVLPVSTVAQLASCWAIAFACIRRNPMLPLQQPPPPPSNLVLQPNQVTKKKTPKTFLSFLSPNYWRPEQILFVLFSDWIIIILFAK